MRWTLFFVGSTMPPDPQTGLYNPSVGAAASFDGVTWERYGGAAAQLSADATDPAALIEPGRGLLLFVEVKRGLRGIAAAHCP